MGFGSNLIIRHLVSLKLKLKLRPKVVSLKIDKEKKHWKLSWVENNSFAIYKLFGENFKFHSNLNILKNTLPYFPSFYKYTLKLSSKYYSNQPSLPLTIISQYLWFNSFIKIGNNVVSHRTFLRKKFVNNFIKENGKFKTWEQITHEFEIDKNLYFKWIQLVHTILNYWRKTFT